MQTGNLNLGLILKNGITLVEVPYWWDFNVESLAATINKLRPELVAKPANAHPIPAVCTRTLEKY